MSDTILEINNLNVSFPIYGKRHFAVKDLSLSVKQGEIFGIVGESGCGKTVTSLSIMRLISPPGKVELGEIFVNGENIQNLSEKEMQRHIRGSKIAMIFQDPMTSLNPLFHVGEQIAETLRIHKKLNRDDAKAEAIRLLKQTGIPSAEKRFYDYPHSFSGGMRQRVMIAIAMCCEPMLLIADEPTTALDVTIQAQILELMLNLSEKTKTSILVITHDIGVIAAICNRVAVMYCGSVVELGNTKEVIGNPYHPYTKGLLKSMPSYSKSGTQLYNIPGTVPKLLGNIDNCVFYDRCEFSMERCKLEKPNLINVGENRQVKCLLYKECLNNE